MSDESGLSVKREKVGEGYCLRLAGKIDDHLNKEEIFSDLNGPVLIDMDQVRRITSFGIREWLSGLRGLDSDTYAFINCRPIIVSQFNMVAGFGGSGQVVSIYAPYICDSCEEEFEILVDLRTQYSEVSSGQLKGPVCTACNLETELDDIPEDYFAYVTSRPAPKISPALRFMIDGKKSVAGQKLRIRKEIHDRFTWLTMSGSVNKDVRVNRAFEGISEHLICDMTSVVSADLEGFTKIESSWKKNEIASIHYCRLSVEDATTYKQLGPSLLAGIGSLLIKQPCPSCSFEILHEVFILRLKQSQGDLVDMCSQCSADVNLELSAEQREQCLSLLDDPGSDVIALLRRRPPLVINEERERKEATTHPGNQRYTRIRRLGAGGMAEVFLATQSGAEGFSKKVVLKRLLPTYVSNIACTNMFLQEARIASYISHPNVVQIYDLGRDRDEFFIAMEYIDGVDLSRVIRTASKNHQLMPIQIACRIGSDICAGLHAAHIAKDENGRVLGIVHRDVSPHNVLVSKQGTIKLVDFGIAKVRENLVDTDPGTIKGKFAYLAPEQIDSEFGEVDLRSDLFAVGVVLFQCLTGRTPFRRSTDFETMRATITNVQPSIAKIRPDVPYEIEKIVNRALEKRPDDRYQSAMEIREDLERCLGLLEHIALSKDVAQWVHDLAIQDLPEGDAKSGLRIAAPKSEETELDMEAEDRTEIQAVDLK